MVKVWDPIVRIGHWTLVVAFFTAYFTEDDFLTQHVYAGYVVGGMVVKGTRTRPRRNSGRKLTKSLRT
jgi:cytochrome b